MSAIRGEPEVLRPPAWRDVLSRSGGQSVRVGQGAACRAEGNSGQTMRLTLRFYILVGALLAAVAASAASGYRALNMLDAALTRVVDSDMQRMLAITHARRLFRSMTVLERDHILARSAAEREGNVEKMKKLGDELVQQLDRYQELMPEGDAERLEKIRGVRARWLQRDAAVLTAALENQDRALTLAKEHKKDPVSWETEIGELVKLSESRLAGQVNQ